jgi:superfamily I DNA and/or RNA helicase
MGIFVTTNLSTRFNIPNFPALFDFVIIDEASQNDIASVLPLMFRAKHAIIIGDPEQLKHITHLKNRQVEKIAESNNLGLSLLDFHYNRRSAFDLAAKTFQEIYGKNSFVLKSHYRSHENIIQFSNYEFYESKLFPKKYIRKDISPLTEGVSWRNVKGNYKDHSNSSEANAAVNFISNLLKRGLDKNISIGIITPFLNQKNILVSLLFRNQLIDGKPNGQIQASTVHSFQGDERDVIIYSPVLSTGIGKKTLEWLDRSTDLLNVALTRARNALVIIGDQDFCMQTEGMHKRLLNYCIAIEHSKNNSPIFESSSERIFYEAIKSAGIEFQYQVPIGRYRADFIFKQEKNFLCVEIDGSQHKRNQSYDYSRDRYFEEIGYKVLRFPSHYVKNNCCDIVALLKKITTKNAALIYDSNL